MKTMEDFYNERDTKCLNLCALTGYWQGTASALSGADDLTWIKAKLAHAYEVSRVFSEQLADRPGATIQDAELIIAARKEGVTIE